MVLYLPYGTDAPIYYRPIVTIAMIVLNYIIYAMMATGPFGAIDFERFEPYMLAVGDGLHPLQWLTTNFLHANFFHLLGNMFFLWVFGLVVEGKLGTFKMLAVYLGTGILYGAIVQIMTQGYEPTHCLGASAIIFGLAMMSLIWAPRNEVYGVLFVWVLVFIRFKHFETKISTLVVVALFLQFGILYLLGGGVSSEFLHLAGAAVGLVVGLAMLKTNLVDCENWDIFSVWSGRNTMSDEDRAKIDANKPKNVKRRAEARKKRQNLLTEEIELALQNRKPLPALVIAGMKERDFPDWTLPKEIHLQMIQQLLGGKHWAEATTSMQQYLARHQEQSVFVRLMLAQALMTQNKPTAVLQVLSDISPEGSGAEAQSAILKIRAKAEAMLQKNREEGLYELDDA